MLFSTSLDLCRDFLEIFPDIQTESINLAQPEAAVSAGFFARKKRGGGLNIFVKYRNDRSFDIEMQVISEKNLPLMAQYYQSVLDISFLHPGKNYDSLKESFVIFL